MAAALLLAVTGFVKAQEAANPAAYITFSDAVIPQGGTGEMEVYYQTDESLKFKAFQIDVPLPEGITIDNVEMKLRPQGINEGVYSRLGTENYDANSKFFATANNGSEKSVVIGFQIGNVAFPTGGKTHLCTLTLKAAEDLATNYDGYATLKDKNYIELTSSETEVISTKKEIEKQTLNIKVFKKGDVNGDGKVGIADVVCIINHLNKMPNERFNKSMANVNQDHLISIADVVSLINILNNSSQQAPKYEEFLLDPQ